MSGRKKSENKEPEAREKRYVKGRAEGKSKKRAALDAGYPESMALSAKAKIESKPEVQKLFRDIMRKVAPVNRIASKISEHMDGKSVTTKARRKMGPPDENGKRAVLEEVVEKTETVDAGVSLKATELAAEWAQYLPEKQQGGVNLTQLTQIQIANEDAVIAKLLGG